MRSRRSRSSSSARRPRSTFVAFAYLGGITTVRGAIVGGLLAPGALAALVMDKLTISPVYLLIIGGIGLMIAVVSAPEGIVLTPLRRQPPVLLYNAVARQLVPARVPRAALTAEPEETGVIGRSPRGDGRRRREWSSAESRLCNDARRPRPSHRGPIGQLRRPQGADRGDDRGAPRTARRPDRAERRRQDDVRRRRRRLHVLAGRVLLDGADISRLAPHRRAKLGLARTWQTTELLRRPDGGGEPRRRLPPARPSGRSSARSSPAASSRIPASRRHSSCSS